MYRFPHFKALALRLALLMAVYTAARALFLAFNPGWFRPLDIGEVIRSFLWGLRFDYAVVFYVNSFFILLHLIPWQYRDQKWFQKLLKGLFIVPNGLLLLPNFTDIKYFAFINKRSSADILGLFRVSNDIWGLMPDFLRDFWYILLFWIVGVTMLFVFYPKIIRPEAEFNVRPNRRMEFWLIFTFAVFSFGIARGIRLKPLRIISAVEVVDTKYTPLVLNTPFTLINTISSRELKPVRYFPADELPDYFNPVVKVRDGWSAGAPKNVVIIILESFSKEYIGALNGAGVSYTPFLDSLIGQGLVFDNAYANGKRSIDAVPSVLSSLPSLGDDSYISSNYSANQLNSLPKSLKSIGYSTAFFHGGKNGTMGFDSYASAAGFDYYYGRNEYHGPPAEDGAWGIFDHYFLRFMLRKLEDMSKPFLVSVFTLSSHHPYAIPAEFDKILPKEGLPLLRSVRYTDLALRNFFEEASNQDWYSNTLFVLTADHTAQNLSPFYGSRAGIYMIPLLFYCPSDTLLRGKCNTLAQQADIMPTVLDYLGTGQTIVAFGKSLFDTVANRFVVNYLEGQYFYFEDNYFMSFDGQEVLSMKRIDPSANLLTEVSNPDKQLMNNFTNRLKAFVQTYNERLLNNRLADTTLYKYP